MPTKRVSPFSSDDAIDYLSHQVKGHQRAALPRPWRRLVLGLQPLREFIALIDSQFSEELREMVAVSPRLTDVC
jgi:hypothetical protein